jgi:hypothetical protein
LELTRQFGWRALALALVAQAGMVVVASPPARADATVLTPVADATAYSDQPTTNFGSANRLVADKSPKIESFLRFEVAGLTSAPAGARLRLWVTDKSSNGPEVRAVTSAWAESTLTWDTRPSVSSAAVDDVGSVSASRWLEFDVSTLVAGNGTVEMALVGDYSDGTDFASREDGTAAHWPQLMVETGGTEPPPPPPPPGDTLVFTPVADAAAYSDQPTTNFGSADRLVADTSPKTESFLRFEVVGPTSAPAGARLRLWVRDKSFNGPEVRAVTSAWDESTLTWDTRPSVSLEPIDDVGSVSASQWLEYDVGPLVTGNGIVEMAVVGDSSDGTDFASREDGNSANWPQLVVETSNIEPPPPPPPPPPAGDAFSFGLVGDTGYTASSVEKFLNVREVMNDAGLTFTSHVGDIKKGDDSCPDSVYTTNRDRFDGFEHPLVYTPGDNEWRDCPDKKDRLSYLRRVFFADDQSRGNPSMTVVRQSADFPENALWHVGPITFVTLHTVGSDNNASGSEFSARNAANIAWMAAAFDAAAARSSTGVVILSHANPGFPPDATSRASKTGFKSYLEALRSEVRAWAKPVLYVHGDTHTFRIDQPTVLGTTLPNLTRVEVYGPSDEHWVRVDYEPSNPALFRIRGR